MPSKSCKKRSRSRKTGVRTSEVGPQPLVSAPGPTSEIQKVFEEVRKLPRRQQRKVLEMVTAFVDMYSRKAS